MDDKQVYRYVMLAQAGDKGALEHLFTKFEMFRKSLAKRMTNRGVDNEEIIQEIDTIFCESILNYDCSKDHSPKRHIVSRTRTFIWNYYCKEMKFFKEERKHVYYESLEELDALLYLHNVDVRYPDVETEVVNSVDAHLEVNDISLSLAQEKIIKLYFDEDMKQTHIADIIGINQSNVSRQIKNAKQRIKKTLE